MKEHKFFFSYRKTVNGKNAPLYHEVIVVLPEGTRFARMVAREIAEQEMKEWREGMQLVHDRMAEERAEHFPCEINYRFVGAN